MNWALLQNVLPALAAFVIVAGSPGPATLTVTATAMAWGRRPAIAMAAGLALGLSVWGVFGVLGLGPVLQRWAFALVALKIVGGGYLLYLAWLSARSALSQGDAVSPQGQAASCAALFRRGLILNLSNPKAALAWVATLVLGGSGPAELAATAVLCMLAGVAIYLAYATVFSHRGVMAGYARFRRWIDAGVAMFLGAAGIRLITARL